MKSIKKFQIGKNGLTEAFIEQVKNSFEHSDSMNVKIDILKSACRDKKHAGEIGEQLIKGLGPNFTYRLVGYVLTIKKWRKSKSFIK